MPDVAPSPEQVREALEELLGWQGISRSPQLSDLLRYVVDKTLAGDAGSIKAYTIAVDVFGRPQSFDPQADPIVRVQARRLRTVLEQFYRTGHGRSAVQIHLPLGRYVPEFRLVEPVAEAPRAEISVARGGGTTTAANEAVLPVGRAARSGLLLNALLGLCFTLIGVALAVGVVRWTLPQVAGPGNVPPTPTISVGPFDNLTGDSALDAPLAKFGPQIAAGLGKFDAISVSADPSALTLTGSVQRSNGEFSVKAILSRGDAAGIYWSTVIKSAASPSPQQAFDAAALTLVAQLGNASGPLHAEGRLWLKGQATLPDAPTLYVCDLTYMEWRDTRRLDDADTAVGCYGKILAHDPGSAAAMAADAGLKAWRHFYLSKPGDDLAKLMVEETTEAAQAVALGSDSSFVYEQEALVLSRQGSLAAAIGALDKAIELNPANMDARAVTGLIAWLSGDFETGKVLSETALTAIPSPPPWYYMARAFDALRERRFYDAIDAAQALAAGDDEFGPAIALAAAPVIGRNDLIDRYRPVLMGNPRLQEVGIMPRLMLMMKPPALVERVREGLTLAGIPPAALDGPFNPDGSAKN